MTQSATHPYGVGALKLGELIKEEPMAASL
jgi:hypothetical protein